MSDQIYTSNYWEKKCEQLKAELEETKKMLERRTILAGDITRGNLSLADLHDENERLTKRGDILETVSNSIAKDKEIEHLRVGLKLESDGRDKLNKENKRLTAENTELKREPYIQKQQALEIKRLEAECRTLRNTGITQQETIERLEAEKSEAIQAFAQQVRENVQLEAELERHKKGLNRMADEAKASNDQIERLREALENLKQVELAQVRELNKLWKAVSITLQYVRNHKWESAIAELEALKQG